jgi:sugar/nucleoside kinase (ribokinase family)
MTAHSIRWNPHNRLKPLPYALNLGSTQKLKATSCSNDTSRFWIVIYSMEIVIAGHLSRDLIILPNASKEALGGGTAYAMLAPSIGAFGAGIVTKVGTDFEQRYHDTLRSSGLNLSGLITEGPKSTRFVNKYDVSGTRVQFVEALAPSIRLEDFTEEHLEANIIHFSPLTSDEIAIDCIRQARSSTALTSLDVQGYIRTVGSDGMVKPKEWTERDAILGLVDVVKFHEQELFTTVPAQSELSAASQILNLGPRIVLVTHDQRGSVIYTRNSQVKIPLVLARAQVDTTGCGDVYTTGFLLEYMRSGDVRRAGLFAATCSSFNVESVGPYNMPTRLMVESRMHAYL